jgi:hypothetical protein
MPRGELYGGTVTFWNWRRASGSTATAGSSAVAVSSELAPIELYTADSRIVAWIAANGQRVTDLLNAQDELRLWQPTPSALGDAADDGHDAGAPRSDDGPRELHPQTDRGEWQCLPTESVILAMPPEWRASRQLRLHKRLRRVALTAGPFSVTGNLHLHPGVEIGHHILTRGQRFLPLTDAYLLHQGEPPFEHVVSVLIVSTAHVTTLHPLVTLA